MMVMRMIWKEGGVRGLWKGYVLRMLKVAQGSSAIL
jgi:hypothetical protein